MSSETFGARKRLALSPYDSPGPFPLLTWAPAVLTSGTTQCTDCMAGKYSPTAGALAFIVLVCVLFWCIASVHALMGCCIRDDSHVWSWQKTPRGAPSCLETMTPVGLSGAMIPK